jgi:hypothetical protein
MSRIISQTESPVFSRITDGVMKRWQPELIGYTIGGFADRPIGMSTLAALHNEIDSISPGSAIGRGCVKTPIIQAIEDFSPTTTDYLTYIDLRYPLIRRIQP